MTQKERDEIQARIGALPAGNITYKTINGRKCYFNSKGVLKKGTPR
jgi:hypothetical protein